ncbi:hypothetical protein BDN70DRAFT_937127 [Pholiota conissans]|uniref:Uncharacterized protein n=1 Tax=Pholiota conissans TaxID=109636 RepID=A0A9P5YRI8_9AGAR|nr:hypothetical protein BDN70DRAFT_937127 [Pholiota conissans]
MGMGMDRDESRPVDRWFNFSRVWLIFSTTTVASSPPARATPTRSLSIEHGASYYLQRNATTPIASRALRALSSASLCRPSERLCTSLTLLVSPRASTGAPSLRPSTVSQDLTPSSFTPRTPTSGTPIISYGTPADYTRPTSRTPPRYNSELASSVVPSARTLTRLVKASRVLLHPPQPSSRRTRIVPGSIIRAESTAKFMHICDDGRIHTSSFEVLVRK